MNLLHIRDILGFWKSVKSNYNKQHPSLPNIPLCTSLTDQLFLGRCEERVYQLQNTPINQKNDSTQVQHRKADSLLGERLLSKCDSKAVTSPHLGDESWKFRHYSPSFGQSSTFTNTSAPEDQVWLGDRRACRGLLNKGWVTLPHAFYKRSFSKLHYDCIRHNYRNVSFFDYYFYLLLYYRDCAAEAFCGLLQ